MTESAVKSYKVIFDRGEDIAQRVPIKSWVPHDLDEGVLKQAKNLANLPFATPHVALMPDAHFGYGMPIGGVLAAENAVVPYAIGVDIGCGVQIARTNLVWEKNFDKEKLKLVLRQIQRDIPTGKSHHKQPQTDMETLEQKIGNKGVDVEEAYAFATGLQAWSAAALNSIGSLGSGNHFLEVQRDDEGNVYFMLHSGSRSLGQHVCKTFHSLALEMNKRWFSDLPDDELAYLPKGELMFEQYLLAMNYTLAWAEVNRETMMKFVRQAFIKHASVKHFDVLVDVHHNYASIENHFGKNLIVHRKGAVRARKTDTVLIPGSMGTNSYIAKGLGNLDSFQTCQHGAGRAVGRNEMKRQMEPEELKQEMKDLDIELYSNAEGKGVVEEAPRAYKPIELVMAASVDLVVPTTRLSPLGVVKG